MIPIPSKVEWILFSLNRQGYEAYLVGGCVRDSLLGRHPQDWDITTSAKPQQVKACFPQFSVLETGIRHGTVTLLLEHTPYEITTFRSEKNYSDHRRPENVEFIQSLEEDLKRRDFTINAMAYHPCLGLQDYFGGQKDLSEHLIRTVGDPEKRFLEDALRILRALRFSSTLGFKIEPTTERAIFSLKGELEFVSSERKTDELKKLLLGNWVGDVLRQYHDLFTDLFPDISSEVFIRAASVLNTLPVEIEFRLAAILFAGNFSYQIEYEHLLKDQKWSNTVVTQTVKLVQAAEALKNIQVLQTNDFTASTSDLESCRSVQLEDSAVYFHVKKIASRYGIDILANACLLAEKFFPLKDQVRHAIERVKTERPCISVKDLAVNGHDLNEIGITGTEVGSCLRWILEEVMAENLPNRSEILIRAAKERVSQKD